MGKHDKVTPATEFSWNPMPDEFYKARIETLERECRSKDKEIEALEHDIEMLKGVIGELKDENDKLSKALGRVVAGV